MNTYQDRFQRLMDGVGNNFLDRWYVYWQNRQPFVFKYAWAIPNDAAIQLCVSMSPIVEMGAGVGYWAHLITEAGGDVIAYDECPQRIDNEYHKLGELNTTWFEINEGCPKDLGKHADRTLLVCWPPYDHPMAADCLKNYHGNNVIFIGEGDGGCTGDNEFFDLLASEWDFRKFVNIPQWPGINDAMFVYARKAQNDTVQE